VTWSSGLAEEVTPKPVAYMRLRGDEFEQIERDVFGAASRVVLHGLKPLCVHD
jgi:hypothetical protein